MDVTQITTRRRALVSILAVGALGLAACVPAAESGPAPPPEPTVRAPTLAEFVTTLRVYDEPPAGPGARDDAVHDLVVLEFGDLGPVTVECVDSIVDGESGRLWWKMNREGSGAAGLTQLLAHADVAVAITGSGDVLNPWVNLVVARSMWDGSGIRPWTPHHCPGVG